MHDPPLIDLSRCPALTRKEEQALVRRMRRGDKAARAEFIRRNLRLVYVVAKRSRSRLPFEDRYSAGCIGLIKAVDKFDPERGNRFCTMATWWIRAEIQHETSDTERLVRIPANVYEGTRVMRSAGIDARYQHATSMDAPVYGMHEAGATLHDVLATDVPPPDAGVYETERKVQAHRFLSGLDPRERRILRRRFGFGDGAPQTLQEIGEDIGLTRERVRQIEAEALDRLRRQARREERRSA